MMSNAPDQIKLAAKEQPIMSKTQSLKIFKPRASKQGNEE